MIVIDDNESPDYDFYIKQSVPIDRAKINQKPGESIILPDFMIYSGGKVVGVNHKQAGEFIGNIDKWEEQVQREVQFGDLDYLVVYIDGVITCEPDGTTYTWKQGRNAWVPNHHFNTSYSRMASVLDRCWELGMPVIRTADLFAGCQEMIQLHNRMMVPDWQHKTFQRFIKSNFFINRRNAGESDSDWDKRRDFITLLMSINKAGVGEEVAVALSMYFPDMHHFMSWMYENEISDLLLESGRRIGGAVDKKLRSQLGIQ